MAKKTDAKSRNDLLKEIEALRERLNESEELISAIRKGEVDAIVVSSGKGEQIYSIASSETPYRYFIEEMNQGAVTVTADRTVVFCNKRFADIVRTPSGKILGADILGLIDVNDKDKFLDLLKQSSSNRISGEFTLYFEKRSPLHLHLSFNSLANEYPGNTCIVATDVTEQKNLEQIILSKVIETEENEKRRFANDLHDDLGPTLSTIKLELAMLDTPGTENSRSEILMRCDDLLKEAVNKIRSISNNMLPRLLDSYGLETAMNAFLSKIRQDCKLCVEMKSNLGELRFGKETELHIYRILCELVNNTLKHSQASAARMNLNFNNETLSITYTDSGKGYNLIRKPNEKGGLGLQIITNRISMLNGRIVFLKKGGNTEVLMKIKAVPVQSSE